MYNEFERNDKIMNKMIKNTHDNRGNYPQRKSTERQQSAVNFCIQVFPNVEFQGDIDSFHDCSIFLSVYLDAAKNFVRELYCEYDTYGH